LAVPTAELLTFLNLHLLGALGIWTPDQVVRIINFASGPELIEHVQELAIGNLLNVAIVEGATRPTRTQEVNQRSKLYLGLNVGFFTLLADLATPLLVGPFSTHNA